ncbi:MAG: aminomethyl-transferring glycine dehydrogenase subunit GcvPA [Deltaproteobacteria bacterium]|nr:aminomethyl-transferring glycine dehydrogenase subunit GcvPA [Deltaproteobacteria bacterium]MBW2017895.1 aminomethyl-transferring glycine dehydrogenase subunit GcvPA [Deltaproteobacteria bacterium]MBW2130577.1 aminomethyl-transferring glycine dehydrogenase subunit GcvPA [Deltaproteobacteria bacterium]MBW2304886.1 aminomethyl-transferring glycine dehydrogenase subunit GcvPA [Deltaproteobacteria bacterium]
MRYLPHTPEDIASMLKVIGREDLEGLFSTIPDDCRTRGELDLPEALTEWELNEKLSTLSDSMAVSPEYSSFLGAGSYEHYIPESVSYLLGRSEFVTSYTPYQPEISQGTLQAIYEFQTLAARLLGMEVATASHYDGSTALAEALLMGIRVTKKEKVAVSSLIHPHYRRVARTYLHPTGFEIIELPMLDSGLTDLSPLEEIEGLAAVAIQSPNFFGCIEDLGAAADLAHQKKALMIASFTEPLAYGLFRNPGSQGADIACGEGQSLGIPPSFGGPALGIFAGKMRHVRNMPGRLVGKTTDLDGRRGFVLTLATREQHIRREKATSNICTNNNLCALAAAMYMASLGGTGFRGLARLNFDKAEYLKAAFRRAGFRIPFESPTFNEFVVEFPGDSEATYRKLLEKKFVAGLPLAPFYPTLKNHYLLCVTETRSREQMDALVREVTS